MKPRKSCDACYMRKTKCDLEQIKLKVGKGSGGNQDGSTISCSFCQSLNLKCKVSSIMNNEELLKLKESFQSPNQHKKGKRIRALLEEANQAEDDDEENGTAVEEEVEEDDDNNGKEEMVINRVINNNEGDSIFPFLELQPAGPKEGIKDAYFTPWALSFQKPNSKVTNGKKTSNSTESAPSSTHQESLSKLLNVPGLNQGILQACIDGYFETREKWIELSQGRAEFERRSSLFLRQLHGLLSPEDEESIRDHTGKNGPQNGPISELLLLAVAARGSVHSPYPWLFEPLVERFSEVVHTGDTLTDAELDGLEAITIMQEGFFRTLHPRAENGKSSTCLRMDPLGKGFPLEFLLFLGVNDPTSVVSRKDPARSQRLFWVCYCSDAIRSASACRMYRLQEGDIGWPFPEILIKFRYFHLASIARQMCEGLFSPRVVKCIGISDEIVLDSLVKISNLPKVLKLPLEELLNYSGSTMELLPEDFDLIKINNLTISWLRLSLSLWNSVQGSKGKSLLQSTHDQVERAALLAAERFEILTNITMKYNLIELGSMIIVSSLAAWFLYFIRRWDINPNVENHQSPIGNNTVEHVQSRRAQLMIDGIRSAKQTKGSNALADSLQRVLLEKIRRSNNNQNGVNPTKRQKRSSNSSTPSNQQNLRKRISTKTHSPSSTNGSGAIFPSEEEQRQGAVALSSSSVSPGTTIHSTQSIGGGINDHQIVSNILPMQATPPFPFSNDSSSTSSMLCSDVMAWDPDLIAFLDSSLWQSPS